MAIVFGWGGGTPKDRGPAVPLRCPNCDNVAFYHYVTSTKWFRLYFIPIIPYSSKHLLLCEVCTSGYELKRSAIPGVTRMMELTRIWTSNGMSEEAYLAAVETFFAGDLPSASPPQLPAASSIGAELRGKRARRRRGGGALGPSRGTSRDTQETGAEGTRLSESERIAPTPTFNYCPSCGTRVAEGAKFCQHCGQALT